MVQGTCAPYIRLRASREAQWDREAGRSDAHSPLVGAHVGKAGGDSRRQLPSTALPEQIALLFCRVLDGLSHVPLPFGIGIRIGCHPSFLPVLGHKQGI